MYPILLKNALFTDLDSGSFFCKDIFLNKNKIEKIDENIDYDIENLKIIDLRECYVLPGIIDCHTHLGIIEEGTGKIGVDNNETSEPITPQLRGIDAINPMDISFTDAIKSGITSVMSGPGSDNAVGGLSIALKTWGNIIDKMVIKSPVGLKIALGENPMSTYGKMGKSPVTRMGTAALIRELFMKTQDYIRLKENGKIKFRDMKLEAVIPVLTGKIPLRAHAHRADDIITAIRIAEEFNIEKLVIEHGTEAHIIKEYLSERKIPVALGPMLTPRIKMELKSRNYKSSLELVECGVKISLITDHPYNSIDQLRTVAALAVSEGLKTTDAIKAITVHPAEIMECQHCIGKLEEGLDADIAVFDGPPLDINSKVVMTVINGMIAYQKDGFL